MFASKIAPDVASAHQDLIQDSFDFDFACPAQMTHWQSPYMHAYFPALNSCPSLLGDMLADAIGCLGFTWVCTTI